MRRDEAVNSLRGDLHCRKRKTCCTRFDSEFEEAVFIASGVTPVELKQSIFFCFFVLGYSPKPAGILAYLCIVLKLYLPLDPPPFRHDLLIVWFPVVQCSLSLSLVSRNRRSHAARNTGLRSSIVTAASTSLFVRDPPPPPSAPRPHTHTHGVCDGSEPSICPSVTPAESGQESW